MEIFGHHILGKTVTYISQPDSAIYFRKGYEMSKTSPHEYAYICLAAAYLGNAYRAAGKYDSARKYLQDSIGHCIVYNNIYIQGRVYRDLATLFNKTNVTGFIIYFSKLGLQICLKYKFGDYASQLSQILASVYESRTNPIAHLNI